MSASLLEEPRTDSAQQSSAASERLRGTMAAVRLSFTWLGPRKSLTVEPGAVHMALHEHDSGHCPNPCLPKCGKHSTVN